MAGHTQKTGQDPGINRLAREKSPYLLQHAHNPVDWFPWGDEAFGRAAELNRPVFLSIGYSTCHWCHVMAHESFEHEEIAGLLNAGFIAIKVDREERPDLDGVYMAACQQMTGQGGWPLTIIMTPQKKPFFAGTYLPRHARGGMTGLADLLHRIADLWQTRPDLLMSAADQLTALLQDDAVHHGSGQPDPRLLDAGYEELFASFDTVNGGFGRAPKFPSPAIILFLLRYWKRTGREEARTMAERTLDALQYGGIHDHLGGGFHRYTTDASWRIPHFEKMLYDQALLLMAFSEAWQVTGKEQYKKTVQSLVQYVLRDIMSPEGAFYSAEDADSPGGEGAYYTWSEDEIFAVLAPDRAAIALSLYGITARGNFSEPGEKTPRNVLSMDASRAMVRDREDVTEEIRTTLLNARTSRTRPGRDTKILADWNGMMIAALAIASRAFRMPGWYDHAADAMDFLLSALRMPDSGLFHRYCDREAAIPGFADDYAWMIRALIELYETGFSPRWLEAAVSLCEYTEIHFADPGHGGYYSSPDNGEQILFRQMEIHDGALPSANAVMLKNLILLGHLTGGSRYEERADRLASAFSGRVAQFPSSSCGFLTGVDHLLGPAMDIVLAGTPEDSLLGEMILEIHRGFLPSVTLHRITGTLTDADLASLAPFTSEMTVHAGRVTAYICQGHQCRPPVQSLESLRDILFEKNVI